VSCPSCAALASKAKTCWRHPRVEPQSLGLERLKGPGEVALPGPGVPKVRPGDTLSMAGLGPPRWRVTRCGPGMGLDLHAEIEALEDIKTRGGRVYPKGTRMLLALCFVENGPLSYRVVQA
jgi:hypothetical protein